MKKLAAMAVIIAMLYAGVASRTSAGVSVPVGNLVSCSISVLNGIVAVGPDGTNAENVNGNGSATFRSVATVEVPFTSTQFEPVALNFQGNDPAYGEFNFQFDAARPAPLTTVTANQPGLDFPATGDVYANCIGTVSGLRGTYRSNDVLHLHSSELHSFNPQENEVYTVAEDATFSTEDGTGQSFTIRAGSPVTLN